MAMQFDLVSPEKRLVSVEATAVQIPGTDGDMTVMPGHAPVITTLKPGILTVTSAEGDTDYVVSGGFAEITPEGCTVLAERSHSVKEMDQGKFDEMLADARAKHEQAKAQGQEGPADEMVKLIADMVAMGTHVGLDTGDAPLP